MVKWYWRTEQAKNGENRLVLSSNCRCRRKGLWRFCLKTNLILEKNAPFVWLNYVKKVQFNIASFPLQSTETVTSSTIHTPKAHYHLLHHQPSIPPPTHLKLIPGVVVSKMRTTYMYSCPSQHKLNRLLNTHVNREQSLITYMSFSLFWKDTSFTQSSSNSIAQKQNCETTLETARKTNVRVAPT